MIDALISGIDSTVAVTSRRAYSTLSAGAISAVWLDHDAADAAEDVADLVGDSPTRKPGMASSLSSVPPVWPRPRPDIIGTSAPQAAASGARMREVLSPTPPVECLSTAAGPGRDQSSLSPERTIAPVRCGRLVGVHAAQDDGHEQGGELVVGPGAVGGAVDEGVDLVGGQGVPVALLADDVDGTHGRGSRTEARELPYCYAERRPPATRG